MPDAASGDHGLKIRISGLSNGVHEYAFETDPSLIGLESAFSSPVRIGAELDKSTRQLLLRTSVETSGRFQCDRCLEEFDRPIKAGYSVVYVYAEEEAANVPPEEVRLLAADTTTIDLGNDVREMVLLSVPLKLLCREECRGLCSRCGKNLNAGPCGCVHDEIDPRWNSLKSLLNR